MFILNHDDDEDRSDKNLIASKFKFQFGQELGEQSSPESLRESPSFCVCYYC